MMTYNEVLWYYEQVLTVHSTGSECTALSPPSIPRLRCPWARHRTPNCPLLRVCVHGVCVFTAVCVHFGWVKCRAQIPSMGNHTWPRHVTKSTSKQAQQPMTTILTVILRIWMKISYKLRTKHPKAGHWPCKYRAADSRNPHVNADRWDEA